MITTKCSEPDVLVSVNGSPHTLGAKVSIPIDGDSVSGTRVKVVFFKNEGAFYRTRSLTVNPAQTKAVSCD